MLYNKYIPNIGLIAQDSGKCCVCIENYGLTTKEVESVLETDTHIKFLLKNYKSYRTQKVTTHELHWNLCWRDILLSNKSCHQDKIDTPNGNPVSSFKS